MRMTEEDYKDEGKKWDALVDELNTGTKPSRYALATRATLEKIAEDFREENKKLREALEEIATNDGSESTEDLREIAKEALNDKN